MSATHDLPLLVAASRAPGVTAISHHSAAHLHGLLAREPTLIHVLAVRGDHPQPGDGVIVHHTRALDSHEYGQLDGFPGVIVTRPASTIVMLGAYLTEVELDTTVTLALGRLCSEAALRDAASRRLTRGRRGPRRVLDAIDRVLGVPAYRAAVSQ